LLEFPLILSFGKSKQDKDRVDLADLAFSAALEDDTGVGPADLIGVLIINKNGIDH
jgi:hypothetical protein